MRNNKIGKKKFFIIVAIVCFLLWYLFSPLPSKQAQNTASPIIATKKMVKPLTATRKTNRDYSVIKSKKFNNKRDFHCKKVVVSLEHAFDEFKKITEQCKDFDSSFYDQESIVIYTEFCTKSIIAKGKENICAKSLLEHRELFLRLIDRNLYDLDSFNWKFINAIMNSFGINVNSRAGNLLYDMVFYVSGNTLRRKLAYLYLASALQKLDTPEGLLLLETASIEDIFDIEKIISSIKNNDDEND